MSVSTFQATAFPIVIFSNQKMFPFFGTRQTDESNSMGWACPEMAVGICHRGDAADSKLYRRTHRKQQINTMFVELKIV